MKLIKPIIFLVFLMSIMGFGQTQRAKAEPVVLKFISEAEIQKDSSVVVTEYYKTQFPENNLAKGIAVSVLLKNSNEIDQLIPNNPIEILAVQRNGNPEKYLSNEGEFSLFIYTGEDKKPLSPGIHEYVIKYRIKDKFRHSPNGEDFFQWAPMGLQTRYDIEEGEFKISFPKTNKESSITNFYRKDGKYNRTPYKRDSDSSFVLKISHLKKSDYFHSLLKFNIPGSIEKKSFQDLIKKYSGVIPDEFDQELIESLNWDVSERILHFDSNIELNKDASIIVTEKIKFVSSGNEIVRGLYRTLPAARKINNGIQKEKYEILSLLRDGKEENYSVKKKGGSMYFYFGRQDITLNPGIHDYEFVYQIKNEVGFFDDFDELYWNASGTDWNFKIDTITATIHFPEGSRIIQNACYTGGIKSVAQDCNVIQQNENSISWMAVDLYKRQGLTIAAGIEKGIITPTSTTKIFLRNWVFFALIPIFIGFLIYLFFQWKRHGKDPDKPVAYPQFHPPENLSPGKIGYFFKESYDSVFLVAGIINLAVKGFLKIETPGSGITYTISRIDSNLNDTSNLPEEEKLILKELEDSPLIVEGRYDDRIKNLNDDFYNSLYLKINPVVNGKPNKKLYEFAVGFLSITTILAGLFSYLMFPKIPGVTLFAFLLFLSIYSVVKLLVIEKKFKNKKFILGAVSILFLFLTYVFSTDAWRELSDLNHVTWLSFSMLGFLILMWYEHLIERPTERKLEIQSLIEGFRMYIVYSESDRIRKLNPPELTPQVFEKILPYALALGEEKAWGKHFDNTLKKSSEKYENSWYSGNTDNNVSFLSGSLRSGLATSVALSSYRPKPSQSSGDSSSYSSGRSGSSGGGYSGGGGGGGGGGGW